MPKRTNAFIQPKTWVMILAGILAIGTLYALFTLSEENDELAASQQHGHLLAAELYWLERRDVPPLTFQTPGDYWPPRD